MNTLTVAEVIGSRRGWHGLYHGPALVVYLDWHPAGDGTYYALLQRGYDREEVWLTADTRLSEHPAQLTPSDLAQR